MSIHVGCILATGWSNLFWRTNKISSKFQHSECNYTLRFVKLLEQIARGGNERDGRDLECHTCTLSARRKANAILTTLRFSTELIKLWAHVARRHSWHWQKVCNNMMFHSRDFTDTERHTYSMIINKVDITALSWSGLLLVLFWPSPCLPLIYVQITFLVFGLLHSYPCFLVMISQPEVILQQGGWCCVLQ